MTARTRQVAAFIAMPADPFAEYHRMSAAFDDMADALTAHDYRQFDRAKARFDACRGNVRETSR